MACASNVVSDRMARVNVSHETSVAKGGEDQSSHRSPLQIPWLQVTRVSQQLMKHNRDAEHRQMCRACQQ